MAVIPVFYLNEDDHVIVERMETVPSHLQPIELSENASCDPGRQLCDKNLLITLPDQKKVPLRIAFHAGKQYEFCYGPYKDLLTVDLALAEKDPRILCGRELTGYWFGESVFSADPVPYYYTWLYLKALGENPDLMKALLEYSAFSDLSYEDRNEGISPAFSAAVISLLNKRQELARANEDKNFLKKVVRTEFENCFTVPVEEQKKDGKKGQKKAPKKSKKNTEQILPDKQLINNMRFPSAFKTGDVIEHPAFGRGNIIDIKTWNTFGHLAVFFEEISSVKTLSESWVRLKCKY